MASASPSDEVVIKSPAIAPFEFMTASRVVFGCGTSKKVPSLVKDLVTLEGCADKPALIVTGKSDRFSAPLVESLKAEGIDAVVYHCPGGEPTTATAEAAIALASSNNCGSVIAIGGGVCMIGYSVVIQYIPPQPEYYMFITIGVGVVVGYFCSNIVKAAALKVVYSVMGGFLTGSCVSYLFWKLRMTQGDLWLDNLVSHGVGLDLTKWQTLTCVGVMVVASFAGVMIQNATAKKGGKKDDKKKAKDEEAGYGATEKK